MKVNSELMVDVLGFGEGCLAHDGNSFRAGEGYLAFGEGCFGYFLNGEGQLAFGEDCLGDE